MSNSSSSSSSIIKPTGPMKKKIAKFNHPATNSETLSQQIA